MGNFCKKRRPQLHQMFQIQTAKLQNSIKKTLFSAIYSGVQNAAAPSLLELLELLTPGAKKKCCMLNYLEMFIAPKLCAINADPSENLHTSSTDRDWDLIKIWTQTVLSTKSYDQNKFQLFLLKKTIRFHHKTSFSARGEHSTPMSGG